MLSSSFGDFFCRPQKAVFSPTLLWRDLFPVSWIVTKFENNLWMQTGGWLTSRELTEAAGPWDERLSFDDDGEYFCRLVARSKLVKFVPTAKVYYRHWSSGSLSQNLSEKACRSLMMSLRLSFGRLLSLEDSPRTRSAALSYLQVWMPCFYPDKAELLHQAYSMAGELGGSLHPPRLPLKYGLIRRSLGWEAAYRAMRIVAACKLRVRMTLDEVI